MSNNNEKEVVLLETDLFGNSETLVSELKNADGITVNHTKLDPAQMQDSNWDDLIQLVLKASKVITV